MRTVYKPWGFEFIWAETEKYVGKVLYIRTGQMLSKQYHRVKDETIMVESGEMHLEADQKLHRMLPGSVFHIPPGTVHRMIAVTDCRVIEVSTPELDDVVRLEDAYGRVEEP